MLSGATSSKTFWFKCPSRSRAGWVRRGLRASCKEATPVMLLSVSTSDMAVRGQLQSKALEIETVVSLGLQRRSDYANI